METVEDILMAKGSDVLVASRDTTALAAAKLMSAASVGSVIIREEGRVLGLFTERDLLRRVVAVDRDPATTTMEQVMSSPVMTCGLADSLDECAQRMSDAHIRHLAVVEQDALIGLISLRDILAKHLAAVTKQ